MSHYFLYVINHLYLPLSIMTCFLPLFFCFVQYILPPSYVKIRAGLHEIHLFLLLRKESLIIQMNKLMKTILFCFLFLLTSISLADNLAKADSIQFILLSSYKETMNIGEERYLLAITTNGEMPTFKSSSSTIASVNTYGKITAKKSGTTTITAKIKKGEASCKVTVNKTKLTISDTRVSIERGGTFQLTASASSPSPITWKSSKKSVAVIDENGVITGMKPGETSITALVDGISKTCNVTVKTPTIKLDKYSVHLYRRQTVKLPGDLTSQVLPRSMKAVRLLP